MWPSLGFPGRCRKPTLAGTSIVLLVGFLSLTRTHTGGHFLHPIGQKFGPPMCGSQFKVSGQPEIWTGCVQDDGFRKLGMQEKPVSIDPTVNEVEKAEH
jgi:hypothetical protein